jgi:DNA repair protein RecO (recombination protein O)
VGRCSAKRSGGGALDWTDDAIVLSSRPHGESGAILEVLTREHGRHLGLVRGGNSRKSRAVLQPGNSLKLEWRARLSEHLGSFAVEPVRSRAGAVMESRDALTGLNSATAIVSLCLPERALHPAVFAASDILLDALAEDGLGHWGPLYVRWEAGLLEALGFGLDLSKCVSTGTTEDLCYVSPRSGRAVSRDAGAPYASRLFALPQFLLGAQNPVAPGDIAAGLKLTGHFLAERVLRPHNKNLPPPRLKLDSLATNESH